MVENSIVFSTRIKLSKVYCQLIQPVQEVPGLQQHHELRQP